MSSETGTETTTLLTALIPPSNIIGQCSQRLVNWLRDGGIHDAHGITEALRLPT